jgi:hypothetical protein
MATNVFNRNINVGQPFSADAGVLTISNAGKGGQPLVAGQTLGLVQQLTINYSQNIRQIWEIGGNNVYFIGGRAAGTATFNRVLIPPAGAGDAAGSTQGFTSSFFDVCEVQTNNMELHFKSGCGGTNDSVSVAKLKMSGCLIVGVTYQTTADEMLISKALNMQFVNLEEIPIK